MNLNFDPFWRSSVGFDRVLDLMDRASGISRKTTIPPTTSCELAKTVTASRWRLPASSPTRSASRCNRTPLS